MEVGMTLDECANTFCELAQVMKDTMNIQGENLMNDYPNNTKQLTVDKVDYRSENGNHQLIIDGVRVALISVSINYVTQSNVSGTNIATFTYYIPGDTTPKIIIVNYQSNEVFDQ